MRDKDDVALLNDRLNGQEAYLGLKHLQGNRTTQLLPAQQELIYHPKQPKER